MASQSRMGNDFSLGEGAHANSLFWWNLQEHSCRYVERLSGGFSLRDSFSSGADFNANHWQGAWTQVEERANELIEKNYGGAGFPSIFKKVGAAAIALTECAPMPSTIAEIFGERKLEDDFAFYPNSLPAVVAFRYAQLVLKGAMIKVGERDVTLNEAIKPSSHFKRDVLYALAQGGRDGRGVAAFSFAFLNFELLAYEANGGFTRIYRA